MYYKVQICIVTYISKANYSRHNLRLCHSVLILTCMAHTGTQESRPIRLWRHRTLNKAVQTAALCVLFVVDGSEPNSPSGRKSASCFSVT